MNPPSEAQSLVLLEQYVQTKSKQFTLQDASSVTGVPVLETEYAVKSLMLKYDCKLKVTENGDLIYDFGTLNRRNAKPFSEYFWDAMSWLWAGFTVFYKFMISAVLIVYFVVFVVIIIAAIIAAMSGGGDKDNKGSANAGNLFGIIFRVFWSIFEWNTINNYYVDRRRDARGYEYQHYEERPSVIQSAIHGNNARAHSASEKGFVASIYDFVFGAPRVETDPLANQQELATFLRRNKGIVCTSELQALAGWEREEAENFLTKSLAYFNGKAEISENATLYGDFQELIRSKDRTGEAPIVYYWDEYEPPHELTGNTGWRNFWIICINLFNLSGALFALNFAATNDLGDLYGLVFYGLGVVPLVYSLLFFIIPIMRYIPIWSRQRNAHKTNIRKRLMRALFQTSDPVISLQKLTQIANSSKSGEEKLDEATVEQAMKDFAYDFKGEMFLDANGKIMYRFEDFARELDDVDAIRATRKHTDSDLGDVIMEA